MQSSREDLKLQGIFFCQLVLRESAKVFKCSSSRPAGPTFRASASLSTTSYRHSITESGTAGFPRTEARSDVRFFSARISSSSDENQHL